MAPTQGAPRALAVLRVGNILLHVNELDGLREVVRAIATPYNLHGPSDVAAARQVPADAEPELATTAAEILACAVAATTVLGSATLAKGMAAARTGMASALKRDLRQLDGAAALLRHPGTAAALLARLRTWRSLTAQGISSPGDGQRSNDDTAASLCVHATSRRWPLAPALLARLHAHRKNTPWTSRLPSTRSSPLSRTELRRGSPLPAWVKRGHASTQQSCSTT